MKIIKYLVLVLFAIPSFAFSQSKTEDIIIKAMKDEMDRNISKLSIDKLKKPFFISYMITDAKTLNIEASLGTLVSSEEKPARSSKVKVLVGDYTLNNENFNDMGSEGGLSFFRGGGDIPLDDDYFGIRRALWLATDREYKNSAEQFEKKISAMKQQNLSREDSLPDLCKVQKNSSIKPALLNINMNKAKWENFAKYTSEIFKKYPDIFNSSVSVHFIDANIYFVNSEGTVTIEPISIAAVQVNAVTMAPDGEPLNDHLLYYELTPDDLPQQSAIEKDIKNLADNLVALRKAPVMDESYTGPVLFEDQAAAELFAQRVLNSNGGLVAGRKGIFANQQILMFLNQTNDKTLEDKMGKKVISSNLSVSALPTLENFGDKKLIGSYLSDADGVKPENEVKLIENGVLKSMLSGRIPSLNAEQSNGHNGFRISGNSFIPAVGPSVIKISAKDGTDNNELKKKLIDKAKEEDLKYVYLVKKVKCSNSGLKEGFSVSSIMSFAGDMQKKGGLSKPINIYRISVADGNEQLVRGAEIAGVTLNSLKKIIGTSNKEKVYNTLCSESGGGINNIFSFVFDMAGDEAGLSGKPVSIIYPDGLILEEVELQKEKRAITSKLPVVSNPVGK